MYNGPGKIIKLAFLCICCFACLRSFAQKATTTQEPYKLVVHYKDSSIKPPAPLIQTSFPDLRRIADYINSLPQLLAAKGYPVASVDSVWQEKSTFYISLFIGKKIQLDPTSHKWYR